MEEKEGVAELLDTLSCDGKFTEDTDHDTNRYSILGISTISLYDVFS